MSAEKIKELRRLTGAGFLDCKKVLEETGGDLDKAVNILREKGLAAAAKKAGRQTAEGVVTAHISDDGSTAVLVEVNCETDFVAKTDEFQSFAQDIAKHIAEHNPTDLDSLLKQDFAFGEGTTTEALKNKIAQFGENMSIRRFSRFEPGNTSVLDAYIHGGGKIGVLAELDCESAQLAADSRVKELAHDLAMHIAASSPVCHAREDLAEEAVANEKEVLYNQAINEGKKPEIAQQVVKGRLDKFFRQSCLLEQAFVRDADVTIEELLSNKSKELGGKIKVGFFVRYERGEGIEKAEDDFAAEVAKLQKD